jgi:glutamate carboxypeptidase
MTGRAQELTEYIFKHKNDFVALLQALVEQETPTDQPAVFTEVFNILRKEFEALNFEVQHITGNKTAGHLLVKPKGLKKDTAIQLVLGHIDTVWEMETLEEMPFKIDENIVAGPGTYDMKTGIAMMIFAMRAIKELGKELSIPPVMLITSDEETGSHESKELIIELAKQAERTFVLEPTLGPEGKIKTRRKGVGNFEVTITGNPSHAGLAPEEGISAILGLSHVVQQLFRLNDPSNGVTVNVGTIEGGERTNVIAAKSKARVDVRIPTKEDGKRIK